MSSTARGTVTTPPPSVASNFTATFTITDGVTTRQATYNGNLSASTQRFDSEPNGVTLTYSKVPSGNCNHEGTIGAGNINLTLTDPDGIKYVVAGKLIDGPSTIIAEGSAADARAALHVRVRAGECGGVGAWQVRLGRLMAGRDVDRVRGLYHWPGGRELSIEQRRICPWHWVRCVNPSASADDCGTRLRTHGASTSDRTPRTWHPYHVGVPHGSRGSKHDMLQSVSDAGYAERVDTDDARASSSSPARSDVVLCSAIGAASRRLSFGLRLAGHLCVATIVVSVTEVAPVEEADHRGLAPSRFKISGKPACRGRRADGVFLRPQIQAFRITQRACAGLKVACPRPLCAGVSALRLCGQVVAGAEARSVDEGSRSVLGTGADAHGQWQAGRRRGCTCGRGFAGASCRAGTEPAAARRDMQAAALTDSDIAQSVPCARVQKTPRPYATARVRAASSSHGMAASARHAMPTCTAGLQGGNSVHKRAWRHDHRSLRRTRYPRTSEVLAVGFGSRSQKDITTGLCGSHASKERREAVICTVAIGLRRLESPSSARRTPKAALWLNSGVVLRSTASTFAYVENPSERIIEGLDAVLMNWFGQTNRRLSSKLQLKPPKARTRIPGKRASVQIDPSIALNACEARRDSAPTGLGMNALTSLRSLNSPTRLAFAANTVGTSRRLWCISGVGSVGCPPGADRIERRVLLNGTSPRVDSISRR
ncbi:predicted protein [Postia placenta Mad-698-R]|nr:predicted protein [Postia placenta Mad-698-R]